MADAGIHTESDICDIRGWRGVRRLSGPSLHSGTSFQNLSQGLNSVFSFFFTATPLIVTYSGRPFLYGG
jgi:hypothetical protein